MILEISVGSISGLKPIYYLFDLCTCSILDQNQRDNDLLFMKYLLIDVSVKETTNKFYGAVYQIII